MGKRRRERDRPKAAHDAMYNPNKRVLLSYESDDNDEDVDQDIGVTENPPLDRPVTKYSANEEATAQPEAKECPSKGDHVDKTNAVDGVDENAEDTGFQEQQEVNEASLWLRPTGRNISTGQWAALGSLSYQYDDDEEEEEYGSEEEDAMAYLRAVR